MPTWKIKEFYFYFKVGEVLEKHEPAHIHVETSRGEIEFWLEEENEEKQIKKIESYVSFSEKNKIKGIICHIIQHVFTHLYHTKKNYPI